MYGEVKSGLKTTEFWAGPVGVFGLNWMNQILGMNLTPDMMQNITWVVVAYIVGRALTKLAGLFGHK